MKNKAIRLVFGLAATIFTFMALSTSASACLWSYYQPKEPECITEKND